MNHNTLNIEYTGSAQLGNCYWASYYTIRSFNRQLDQKAIDILFEMGYLGYGQGCTFTYAGAESVDACNKYHIYKVKSTCDSSD